VKIDAPCPACSRTPVDKLDLIDGSIWSCPGCGYIETEKTMDIEAQLADLDRCDPELAEAYRDALGL
tara:strand:+ start:1171 stop:1371 length:201 start_codon:yes stop_codon:yes gene_type:complete